MNLEKLQSNLLTAARRCPPDERVPYAFERRIMARLASSPRFDPVTFWNRMLWRAAVPCLLVMLTVSLWAFLAPTVDGTTSLGTELEDAILAPAYAAIQENW
jgi:hypothetical protein